MAKIQHRHNRQYTVINNHVYEDKKLKLPDIGLFDLLYHFPEDWNFREVDLAKRTSSGRTALRTSIKNLERFGYLKRERKRNKKGQLVSTNWILDDEGKLGDNSISKSKKGQEKSNGKPLSETPTTEKQLLVKPSLDNSLLQSTIPTKYSVCSSKYASKESPTDKKILVKNQSEHSLDDPEGISKAYNLWNKVWGKPSDFIEQQISQWVSEFGLDVVLHAFNYAKWKVKQASSAGSYLAKVFGNYRQNNVKSALQAETADKDNLNQSLQRTSKNKFDDGESPTVQTDDDSPGKDEHDPAVQTCYQAAIDAGIKLTPVDQEQLAKYVHQLGKEVVLYGIVIAKRETRYNQPSWGFLNSILNRCLRQGITKPEEVQSTKQTTRGRKKRYGHHPYEEPMPAWSKLSPEELKGKASPEMAKKVREKLANRKKGGAETRMGKSELSQSKEQRGSYEMASPEQVQDVMQMLAARRANQKEKSNI